MSTILTETEGFTPVIDVLAQELGLMTAVVYGIVWRYCQMRDKICSASLDILANHIAVDRKTIERHIKVLCEIGYLTAIRPIPPNILRWSGNNGRCEYCLIDFAYPDKHHIIPLSEGGQDFVYNITYLCPNCHRLAHLTQYIANCKIIADGWKIQNE